MNDDDFAPTRASLIQRLKESGTDAGWREFFDIYGRLIYSVARKSGLDDGEAQDLVQETVVSVSRKIAGFRYDPSLGSFKNWLLLITRSRIADCLRKKYRRPALVTIPAVGDGTTFLSGTPDPALPPLDQMWEQEWQEHLLQTSLRNLKSRVSMQHYQVFQLTALEQLPPGKVAATLGVNVARVYLIKHRVGRLLKAELARLRAAMEKRLAASAEST